VTGEIKTLLELQTVVCIRSVEFSRDFLLRFLSVAMISTDNNLSEPFLCIIAVKVYKYKLHALSNANP